MRKISISLFVLFLLATTAVPAWAQDEVEVEGAIESVEDGAIVVGGITFLLAGETDIIQGRGRGQPASAEDLAVGVWVDASGDQQEDGTVLARRVRIKPGPEDDDGGEEEAFPAGFEHPVATKLALYFDITYEEAMALFDEGVGFGQIMKAYRLADANPEAGFTGADLLEMKLSGMGWGEIWHETGVHPGSGPPPWANNDHEGKENGPPPWAGGDDEDGGGGPPPWAGKPGGPHGGPPGQSGRDE